VSESQLETAKVAWKNLRELSAGGEAKLEGIVMWACSASHQGKTHWFLMRYDDGQVGRVWSMEWNPSGIVRQNGDLDRMQHDLTILKMFLS
jgi:hypothetical protein